MTARSSAWQSTLKVLKSVLSSTHHTLQSDPRLRIASEQEGLHNHIRFAALRLIRNLFMSRLGSIYTNKTHGSARRAEQVSCYSLSFKPTKNHTIRTSHKTLDYYQSAVKAVRKFWREQKPIKLTKGFEYTILYWALFIISISFKFITKFVFVYKT